MKRTTLLFLSLALIGVFAFLFYFYEKELPDTGILTLYGNVDIRQVQLGFRVPGKLERLLFEEGDEVEENQPMAFLDARPFQEALKKAEASKESIAAALKNANLHYLRREELIKTDSVSLENYDEALAVYNEKAAQLAGAEAQVEIARIDLEDTVISSPANGVILTRVKEPGTVLRVGDPVYVLSLSDPVWVRAYVSEPDLGKIYPGIQAEILTDSGSVYKGQIGFISPQAEFTPKNVETQSLRTDLVYRLRVIVDNHDKKLRQGMPVTVRIFLNQLRKE